MASISLPPRQQGTQALPPRAALRPRGRRGRSDAPLGRGDAVDEADLAGRAGRLAGERVVRARPGRLLRRAELGTPEEAARARAYDTFTGKPPGASGEVRFVYRIAAPERRVAAAAPSARTKGRSWWQRLRALLPGGK